MEQIKLIDYFAGLAMQSLVKPEDINDRGYDEIIAKRSFAIARQMQNLSMEESHRLSQEELKALLEQTANLCKL